MTLMVSNYKIAVYTSRPLVGGDSAVIFKSDYGLKGYGEKWHFKVYRHASTPSFLNVTGLRCLSVELALVKAIIRARYRVGCLEVRVNQVFCSRSLAHEKLSFCLGRMKRLGEQLFGEKFIFFYEPEFGSVLQMTSRHQPKVSLMLYGTSSVCCFLPHEGYIPFCEDVLKQLYVESNLKSRSDELVDWTQRKNGQTEQQLQVRQEGVEDSAPATTAG